MTSGEFEMASNYDGKRYWITHLTIQPNVKAAPVSNFSHAPLAHQFDEIARVGLIVEAVSTEPHQMPTYWFARVMRVAGYLVQLRWMGGNFFATSFRISNASDLERTETLINDAFLQRMLIPHETFG